MKKKHNNEFVSLKKLRNNLSENLTDSEIKIPESTVPEDIRKITVNNDEYEITDNKDIDDSLNLEHYFSTEHEESLNLLFDKLVSRKENKNDNTNNNIIEKHEDISHQNVFYSSENNNFVKKELSITVNPIDLVKLIENYNVKLNIKWN